MGEIQQLSELKPKDKGIIKAIKGAGSLRRRLLDMGIIPGSPIEVVKLAPLGDPINLKIKGYLLSLRKDEAAGITVEVENV